MSRLLKPQERDPEEWRAKPPNSSGRELHAQPLGPYVPKLIPTPEPNTPADVAIFIHSAVDRIAKIRRGSKCPRPWSPTMGIGAASVRQSPWRNKTFEEVWEINSKGQQPVADMRALVRKAVEADSLEDGLELIAASPYDDAQLNGVLGLFFGMLLGEVWNEPPTS